MSVAEALGTMERESAVQEEIGVAAGTIWRTLAENGECTLPKLRKSIECSGPVFDWALGWLAREDKIAISRQRKSFLVHLK